MSDQNMEKIYTGIGARETPENITAILEKLAAFLADEKYVLRSGAAEGASAAFERGCDSAGGPKEIYLPWRGFNGNNSNIYTVTEKALAIVSRFNPAWVTLNDSAKKLQGRYAHSILGEGLNRPSKFIICYTKEGKKKGGTGQALKVAERYTIPVIDLGDFDEDPSSMPTAVKEFLTAQGVDAGKLEL